MVLSFPSTPDVRFDAVYLTYNLDSKSINALIRELKDKDAQHFVLVDMLDAFSAHWAHPLLVPVILLDLMMSRLEGGIITNVTSIERLENIVGNLMALNVDTKPLAELVDVTDLLTKLHNILKGAIKLLDATRWMHRTSELLRLTGEELEAEFVKNGMGTAQLQADWFEIKYFLEDLISITANLEPEPMMSQQRCQSQIDIVSVNHAISIELH